MLRVHSLSSNDPLYTGGRGGGAHDAFSCFEVLFHNNDRHGALTDAGDNWLSIDGESWNAVRRRNYAQNKAQSNITDQFNLDGKPLMPFDLANFSLSGKSRDMELKMLDDKFVLKGMALIGQATVIYAKPNTGKTLLTLYKLAESIKNGEIDGQDLFYINADDSLKGLLTKLKLAEQYGFHMLAPDFNGFESKQFLVYMDTLVKQDTASGKIIILDTLKKFTNLMDKKTATEFMTVGRKFVSKGGTLILLAHTNKNRNSDGKVVFGGTSDIVDDVDCAYTLDEVEIDGSIKKVIFENIKNRGDVMREIAYQYNVSEGQTYLQLFDSVSELDKQAAEHAAKSKLISVKLAKNCDIIQIFTEAIESGLTLKTELIEYAHKVSDISRPKLTKILNEHTGLSFADGHRWNMLKGAKNAKNYYLLRPFSLMPPEAQLEDKDSLEYL